MGSLGEKYYNEGIIDIQKYLTNESLETLRKLGIKVENKVYSAYEYEVFSAEVSLYYKEEDYSKEELEVVKSLEGTGVSQEEYDNLISNLDRIGEIIYSIKY